MHWLAPSEKDTDIAVLEKRPWDSADQFRANSSLKPQEYFGGRPQGLPGSIFLRIAEVRFEQQRVNLGNASASRRGSRRDEPAANHAEDRLCA